MGHRDDRDGDAGKPADLRGKHSPGIDDDVGGDRLSLSSAPLDLDTGDAATVRGDRHDPAVGLDRGAPRPGARSQRLGQP